MSFGWSAGDILAAAKFLVQVGQALRDTNGASSDYQQTSLFLGGLGATLQRIKVYDEQHEDQGLLEGLQKDIKAVLDAVNGFNTSIQQTFGPSLGAPAQRGWGKISTAPRKVQYALFVSKKAKALQEKIATPLTSIQMGLGIENLGMLANLQNVVIRIPEETSERVKETIENIFNQQSETQGIESERKLFRQVSEWLLDHRPAPDDFHTISRKLHSGTCEWIFEKPSFQEWVNDVNDARQPLFWIYGNPGAGKSCLVTRIIRKFQEVRPIAYFYCDAKDERKRSTLGILRIWVWQLLVLFRDCLPGVAAIYDKGTLPTISNLCEALKLLVPEDKSCTLVLDGLDECEPPARAELFSILPEILAHYKVLIVSRHERDIALGIAKSTKGLGFGSLQMSQLDNEADINGYLVDAVEEMDLGDEELQKKVLNSLQRNAKGMFLWANLMVQDLSESGGRQEEYEMALNDLPESLDEVYGRILLNLHSNTKRRRNSEKLFQWLTCAVRPLTLEEFGAVLSFDIGDERSQLGKKVPNIEGMIRICCGSLVEIDSTGKHTIVRLIHASVRDFLLTTPSLDSGYSSLLVNSGLANTYIGRCCITYLCFEDIDLLFVNGDRNTLQQFLDQHRKKWPLLNYAAPNWSRHLSIASGAQEPLSELRRLYASDTNTIKWLQLLSSLKGDRGAWHPSSSADIISHLKVIRGSKHVRDEDEYQRWLFHLDGLDTGRFSRWYRFVCGPNESLYAPVLHIAAFFDFDTFGKKLLQQGHSIDIRNDRGATALHQAARADAINAAKMLLQVNATVDAKDNWGSTSLIYSLDYEQDIRIRSGPFEVAILLIEAGADVCIKDADPYTSLLRICDIPLPNDEHIVTIAKVLLDHGATKILNEGAQGTPVGWASMINSLALLRTFLTAGAYVDAGMGDSRNERLLATPLVQVCELKNARAIPVLIDAGASVHARDFDGRTSLHKTARLDSYEASKLLLERGTDVNAIAIDGSMPIHEAVREGHINQIQLLLEYHSKLEVEDSTGRTPLDIAVDNGSSEAVRLLIEAGANVNRKGRVIEINDGQILVKVPKGSYQPKTVHDIFHVHWVLTQGVNQPLPRSVALKITNFAEYWLKTEASRSDFIIITEKEVGPTYLRSPALTLGVKKMVFQFESHDQGFSNFSRHHGSYNHSYTWFDAAVFDVQGRPIELDEGEEKKLQVNVHASGKRRLHTVVFGQGQQMRYGKWFDNLRPGNTVGVVPVAKYPGWANHVYAVRMEIYTSCLRD